MNRLRVLLVEDSLTVRMRLREVLSADPHINLVGEAVDGKQAIELCQSLRPDVISMDMMLPIMSGLAATEFIMAYCPTPILVVSSSFNRGEIFKTYEALSAGAVEVMEKPTENDVGEEWDRRYLAMLMLVARVKVVTHLRARMGLHSEHQAMPIVTNSDRVKPLRLQRPTQLIAIGASTGGPGALVEVLRAIPANFPLPVLIVIHIGEPFGTTFAEWLDTQTSHRVQTPTDGQRLTKSGVYIAPANRHMVVRDRTIYLDDGPERHSCRPSVDVLFESVAQDYGPGAAGCLLTGMGHDGAAGMLALSRAGGVTIAQDEASCVVYGMPREAVLLGAVQQELPLSEIGAALAALTTITPAGGGP